MRIARFVLLSIWLAAGGHCVADELAPVRFALSFDDGPSARKRDNPTEQILAVLAANPVQNGIKAIFFVQTRSADAGASARGAQLLASEYAQGHELGLHSGTAEGHVSHVSLSEAKLDDTLAAGIDDIALVTSQAPSLVRPPYWAYNNRTLAAYDRHGLAMLLTDITANDGKTWGFHASPRRRSHIAHELTNVRERMQRGEIMLDQGVAPIVVTFHDTNDYTAAHMEEYLRILVDEASASGLKLADKPFYDTKEALERASLVRARDVAHRSDMVPWWWKWMSWLH